MVGMYRFLEKIWKLFQEVISNQLTVDSKTHPELKRKLHQTIQKVTQDIAKFKYNTAIAALMELTNQWKDKSMSKEDAVRVVKLLAPLAPYIAEELYQSLRKHEARNSKFESIHTQAWPEFDEKLIREDEVTVIIQVNGKVRNTLQLQATSNKPQVIEKAEADEKVKKYLEGKRIKNVVWVPQKLVNFVVE